MAGPGKVLGAVLVLATAAGTAGLLGYDGQPTATTRAAATQDSGDKEAKAARFNECMRTHGVPDYPGVTIGRDGQVWMRSGRNVDVMSKSHQKAIEACGHLLPAGTNLPPKPEPPSALDDRDDPSPKPPAVGCTANCPTVDPPKPKVERPRVRPS